MPAQRGIISGVQGPFLCIPALSHSFSHTLTLAHTYIHTLTHPDTIYTHIYAQTYTCLWTHTLLSFSWHNFLNKFLLAGENFKTYMKSLFSL